MSILKFFKEYNNYYNRIVKHDLSDIANYTQITKTNRNFNPNDGLHTELVENWDQNWTPDYMMIVGDTNYNPDYMLDNLNIFNLKINDVSQLNYDGNEAIIAGLSNGGFLADKTINLTALANYNNPNYDSVDIELEGEWAYSNFSIKIDPELVSYATVRITSDNNTINLESENVPSNGIIDYHVLADHGWTGSEDIWGIYISASSPDSVYGNMTLTDYVNDPNIEQRWFILESQRTRSGQYKFTLKRDIIADNYDKVINAPMIVNRAMVNDINNPLLYNPEGFSFNQIKKQEILLKDKTLTPWYVLYFKKETPTLTDSFNPNTVSYDKQISTTLENSIFATGTKYYINEDNSYLSFEYRSDTSIWGWLTPTPYWWYYLRNTGSHVGSFPASTTQECTWFINDQEYCKEKLDNALISQYNNLSSELNTDLGYASGISEDDYNTLLEMNGKYILDSANKLYKISINTSNYDLSGGVNSGTAFTRFQTLINNSGLTRQNDYLYLKYKKEVRNVVVSAQEVDTNAITWEINWSNNQPTIDSDFNIIAIPYGDITVLTDSVKRLKANTNLMLVQSIISKSATNLVDIQLLPYCPLQEAATGVGANVNLQNVPTNRSYFDASNSICILFVQSSNFSFNIEQSLTVPATTSDNVKNYKISNECDLYKIVSPNYNGSFEFSVAKNQGVDYFNVDCTLIPYQPYIHINPNFKGLYGQDWNDAKGLICGGDFSLPRYTDKWEEYQLNNKNYQQIFDRQVRNIDFTQGQERTLANISAVTGVVQGTTSGAITGAIVGGGYGAVAGAAVGGVTSTVGGIADIAMMNARQSEQKSMILDNYRYQLGNIKALPDTINKTTPLTYNNKKWPFIEVYSATDTEKLLLDSYLTYRSMNINSVGNMEQYMQNDKTFISGDLIRLEELDTCSNEAFEIYNEIKKGVYI